MRRIYLDNAATSWPKPESVYRAVDDYSRNCGAAAGRGVYTSGVAADRIVGQARKTIATLLGVRDPKQIVFTLNCTDSLNLALFGAIKPGDVVLTSNLEHNSILRPLRVIRERLGIEVIQFDSDDAGRLDLSQLAALVKQHTEKTFVVLSHASNVTGIIQPLSDIIELTDSHGARLLIDAAQSAGAIPIRLGETRRVLLAASGHKGLLGPLGTGLLYVSPGLEQDIKPLRFGGTGTQSDEDIQPTTMPERFESGNLNTLGIAGLAAGAQFVLERRIEAIGRHEFSLIDRLHQAIVELPGVRTYGPPPGEQRVGLLAFTIEGFDSREFASLLDANFGIELRAGLHCAPLIHTRIAAPPGGTIRASVGPFTTDADIDSLIEAIREITASS